jgi:NADH-quinone oxidoreductase subunit I
MFGWGVVKGLGVTLRNFVNTYTDDVKYWFSPPFFKSVGDERAFARRQGPEGAGLFTVEYPEVKLKLPENFRVLPFLVTDYEVPKDSPDFDRAKWLEQNRCTSCGICAKVCPPQCIWIVRSSDPETGKPIPQPAEFYIDIDICMNCGYCAEFCPFDAIKMDHDFELSDYEREVGHIHDLERLLKPASYYASIRPTWYAQEEEARRAAEEEKRRKEEKKKRLAAEKSASKAAKPKRTPEEIKAQREAMLAKKQQRAEQAGGEAASPVAKLDDLTRVEGIGPRIAALFQEAGIITFAQLAVTEVSKLKQILIDAGPQFQLADPSTWPEQAKLAATGKWEELEALQDKLKGGRRDE